MSILHRSVFVGLFFFCQFFILTGFFSHILWCTPLQIGWFYDFCRFLHLPGWCLAGFRCAALASCVFWLSSGLVGSFLIGALFSGVMFIPWPCSFHEGMCVISITRRSLPVRLYKFCEFSAWLCSLRTTCYKGLGDCAISAPLRVLGVFLVPYI